MQTETIFLKCVSFCQYFDFRYKDNKFELLCKAEFRKIIQTNASAILDL